MSRKLWLEGREVEGATTADVRAPWDGTVVTTVEQASKEQATRALEFAAAGRARLQNLPAGQRREVLFRIARGLEARGPELAGLISREAGKPITAARAEVARAIETFTLAASELSRFGGEIVPVDLAPGAAGAEAEVRRFPAGVVVGIVPFNFPLNLGAHKVAPALAVGAPIIVKPPPQAPSAQLVLAELAHAAGADPAALQVLPCATDVAEALATDERVRVLSFTGSARVGWHLKQLARGKAVLELGGNAAAIVCADADLERAVSRLVPAAFGFAGQVCIKAQRLIVEASVWDAFTGAFLAATAKLGVGDPALEPTVVGPVIDDVAAERIEAWLREAVAAGAKVLAGGPRRGRLVSPTVLTNVPRTAKASCEEIFGPVVVLEKADDFGAALQAVNDSRYGLQASLFTNELSRVRRAFHELEVGGVIVNDAPNFRSDSMPYGGVKGSGLGREGVRYAMEDFTEPRVLVYR